MKRLKVLGLLLLFSMPHAIHGQDLFGGKFVYEIDDESGAVVITGPTEEYKDNVGDIVITSEDADIVIFGESAFENNLSVTSLQVDVPVGCYVKAFANCSSLKKVDFSKSDLVALMHYSFLQCGEIEDLLFPESTSEDGGVMVQALAFWGTQIANTVTIPENFQTGISGSSKNDADWSLAFFFSSIKNVKFSGTPPYDLYMVDDILYRDVDGRRMMVAYPALKEYTKPDGTLSGIPQHGLIVSPEVGKVNFPLSIDFRNLRHIVFPSHWELNDWNDYGLFSHT